MSPPSPVRLRVGFIPSTVIGSLCIGVVGCTREPAGLTAPAAVESSASPATFVAVSSEVAPTTPGTTALINAAEVASPSVATPVPQTAQQPVATQLPASRAGECVAAIDLDLRVRQTLMPAIYGDQLDEARTLVESERPGSVLLMTWPAGASSSQLEQAVNAGDLPALVAVDEEGGKVQRLKSLGALASEQDVAATMQPDDAGNLIAGHANDVAALGIDIVFGPVVDVGDAPPIGSRSFGDDAAEVTAYAQAYIDGWHTVGITPVIKHFPGHGRASADTHLAAATTPPLDELQASDLLPYQGLSSNSNLGVMVGHLNVPGLTDVDGLPTSLSPAAYALLRDDLGYGDALVFTDSLNMGAVSSRMSLGKAAVYALNAGADVLVFTASKQTAAVAAELVQTAQNGELNVDRLNDAVARILERKGVDPCSMLG